MAGEKRYVKRVELSECEGAGRFAVGRADDLPAGIFEICQPGHPAATYDRKHG
jgi:hypothetical protein